MNRARTVRNLAGSLLFWLLSLVIIVPVAIILLNSIKTQSEADIMNFALPKSAVWQNYAVVIQRGKIPRAYLNSLIMSVSSLVLVILTSSMAGFVVSRNPSRLNRGLYTFFFLGLIAPLNMAPVFNLIRSLGLINRLFGVIMMFTALLIPFSLFLYYSFMIKIPRELDEAVMIDGGGPLRLFWQIIFPLLKPVTVTLIILNFVNTWNDFMLPLYLLYDSEKWPITLTIYDFLGRFKRDWSLVSANIVLTILPILVVYGFGQRYIIDGMVSGSLKG